MWNVQSFADVERALKELNNQIEKLNANPIWDMQKKRIVNASPSVESYDYVVRKELDQLRSEIDSESKTSGVFSNHSAIVFSNDGTPAVATLSSPPFIVKQQMQPLLVCISAVQPPTSADATFNVLLNQVQILPSNIVMPVGTGVLDVITTSTFNIPNLNFAVDDTVVIQTIAHGGISKFTIEVFVKKL